MRTSTGRAGSVLATVVLLAAVMGLLASALMDRSIHSSTRAAWSRDHLTLRLLAESGAEELGCVLATASNDPGSQVFLLLRTIIPDEGEPTLPAVVPGLEIRQVASELAAHEKAMGASIRLASEVTIQKAEQVSDDGLECRGVLRIAVAATAVRRLLAITERVTVDRPFRVARTLIHHPLQLDALIVKKLTAPQPDSQAATGTSSGPASATTPQGQPEGTAGQDEPVEDQSPDSYFNPHVPGSRPMQQILGGDSGKAMRPSPPGWMQNVADAISFLYPREARMRAHFNAHRPGQLRRFIQRQLERGVPATGVYFSSSREPLLLSFPRFVGKAVIVARGPVVVGDIRVFDPRSDSLTIAAGRKLRVVGTRVEASLVSYGGSTKGVEFGSRTQVVGTVISQSVPRDPDLPKEEFDASEISSVEGVNYDGNEDAAPPDGRVDVEELEKYVTMFSPDPVRVNHSLD